MAKKVFKGFGSIFNVYLIQDLQNYQRNLICTVAFWATTWIARPIRPIRQLGFALACSALKKPLWEFNFFDISVILLSSKHGKCCQILWRLFLPFQSLRFLLWFWDKHILDAYKFQLLTVQYDQWYSHIAVLSRANKL